MYWLRNFTTRPSPAGGHGPLGPPHSYARSILWHLDLKWAIHRYVYQHFMFWYMSFIIILSCNNDLCIIMYFNLISDFYDCSEINNASGQNVTTSPSSPHSQPLRLWWSGSTGAGSRREQDRYPPSYRYHSPPMNDVIAITFNYRLNFFGLMGTGM